MVFEPKVSIVIPVYNGANFLKFAIDSALAQTYKHVEILVINDGSNDESKTEIICKNYGDKIRYFYKENGGAASALNFGIEKMEGDFFSWLSHDDLYYAQKVEKQVELLQSLKKRDVIIYSDYDLINKKNELISPVCIPHYTKQQFPFELMKCSFLHGCSLLVPMECFETVGPFDETLATTQDYQLWLRMSLKYDFIHLPERVIQARLHAEQGSNQDFHHKEIDDFYVWALSQTRSEDFKCRYGTPTKKYFYDLAVLYKSRNLMKAYHCALDCFLTHTNQEGIFSSYRTLLKGKGFSPSCINWLKKKQLDARNFVKKVKNRINCRKDVKSKFTKIYNKNLFLGKLSRSGEGSDLLQTKVIREEIPKLLQTFDVRILVDAPCGDFFWMKEVDLKVEKYIGIDIVENIINANKQKYEDSKRSFICRDLGVDSLPQADLILCRDCLVHLTFELGISVLENFKKSGSAFLLATTFTNRDMNLNTISKKNIGNWRPLNMQLPPFSFPNPITIINEECSSGDGEFKDKSLGLWRLEDIFKY